MYSKVLARPFPKGTVPFGGSNVPFGSASKETMCPLAPPQNQPIFNSHLNYLNLKTVWALSIELSEHWTQLKCFVDSGTHATNVWSDKSLHSRWGVWSWYYLCPLACKFWWEHCTTQLVWQLQSLAYRYSLSKWDGGAVVEGEEGGRRLRWRTRSQQWFPSVD